ncbi:DUF4224 domain-containing protein [Bordetella avium]|uniref:Phage protein n=1 Tax=Bordetella avium (strain 197N) TaxID=360910 RepID=Q2KZB0_BORA1|nr:DUF4224 domain-containing protein [Bordetella avium]RIQ18775.1 DUF4224 domain-containing protein [Bordetella avium]RIQ53599.1 DUF4224 domain-containing protein [Bordetella avium]CAJ47993.1 phage protein [Bordetella avium 197N]
MAEFLTQDDLRELTGYSRAKEQRQMLDKEGIPYKALGGRTIVLASHISAWIEGRSVTRHSAPDMSMIT